jgi:hypothetical protein
MEAEPVEPVRAQGVGFGVGDPTRVVVDVVTVMGSSAAVEFRVRLDTVEVWGSRMRCCGIFDREVLRSWLAAPGAALVCDEVVLTLDRMVDVRGRVALSLPGVREWTLSEVELVNLRDRL